MSQKRTYLSAADRRRDLIDAAGRLFARGGFREVTMVRLAAEAGVSRPLVYKYFPNQESLYVALFEDRSANYVEAVDAIQARGLSAIDTVRATYDYLLAIDLVELTALTALTSSSPIVELAEIQERVRALEFARWIPTLPEVKRNGAATREALWILVGATTSLAASARQGRLSADEGRGVLTAIVTGTVQRLDIAPQPHAPGGSEEEGGDHPIS